jgi:hypothetical protein
LIPQNLQPPIIQSLRLDSDLTLSEPIELNSADAGLLSITKFPQHQGNWR